MSCKATWEDRACVVEYSVQSIRTYFCLKCDEYVKDKSPVFEEGWSLLDGAGYLHINL